MKTKTLYIILAICLVIIAVLLTILFMSNKTNNNDSQTTPHTHQLQKKNLPINYSRYPYPIEADIDIDYAYDYDGYWFQPSRWWNNLWTNRRYNMYNRRDNYDRRDGLDRHHRYVHNSININPTPAPSHQGDPVPQTGAIQPSINQPSINQNGLSLSEGTNSSRLTPPPPIPPSPYLSSVMPEEVSISPMSRLSPSENIVQTISTFVSDISDSYPTNYSTGYVSNLNYKGPDVKNHKPFPVDMMASESIYLQPNTVANQIIVPPIVKNHPNPN